MKQLQMRAASCHVRSAMSQVAARKIVQGMKLFLYAASECLCRLDN